MKSFRYRFLDRSGRVEVGTIQADSIASAHAHLAREGIDYLSITEPGSSTSEPNPDLPPPEPRPPRIVDEPSPGPPRPESTRPIDPPERRAARPGLAFGSMFGAVAVGLASPVLVMILGSLIYEGREGWSGQGAGFGFFFYGICSTPIFLIQWIAVGCCWKAMAMRAGNAWVAAFARVGVALYPAPLIAIIIAIAADAGLFSAPASLLFLILSAWPVAEVAGSIRASRRP